MYLKPRFLVDFGIVLLVGLAGTCCSNRVSRESSAETSSRSSTDGPANDGWPAALAQGASKLSMQTTERSASGEMMVKGIDAVQPELSDEEANTLRTWFKKDYSVRKAAEVGGICLRHKLSKSKIVELIGRPTIERADRVLMYAFAPSQWLEFTLDDEGNVESAMVSGTPVRASGDTDRKNTAPDGAAGDD